MKRMLCPLTFWFLLLVLLTGCEGREKEEIPEAFCEVKINLDWEGVVEMPDRVQVIFYPQGSDGKPTMNNLPANGGTTNVKPGKYKMLIYNCDNGEYEVKVRNIDKIETIEAYSEPYTALAGQGLVWEPLPIYAAQVDVTIEEIDKEKTLDVKPKLIPQTCSFELKVKGLEYVSSVNGSISGVAASYYLGLGCCSTDTCSVFFEMQKGDGVLKGKFNFFGVPAEKARAFAIAQLLTIKLVKRDNSVQEIKVDVTEAIQKANTPGENPGDNPGGTPGEDPGEKPGGSTGGGNIEIEIEEEIEIPYVPPPPSEDGGGIGGEVGDWGEEEEVVIPMK